MAQQARARPRQEVSGPRAACCHPACCMHPPSPGACPLLAPLILATPAMLRRRYWKLGDDANMYDLILAIRADEACHSHVNHTFARIASVSPAGATGQLGAVCSCRAHHVCGVVRAPSHRRAGPAALLQDDPSPFGVGGTEVK